MRFRTRFLREQYALRDPNFGYLFLPNHAKIRVRNAAGNIGHLARHSRGQDRDHATLWPALFQVFPDWTWGNQGTGDCVSWEAAHKLDVLLAILAVNGKIEPPKRRVASEPCYGFARVEGQGRSVYYGGPGTSGRAMQEGLKRFGTLYRQAYGAADLSKYSGSRAVQYGRSGVPDELEPEAANHKVRDAVCVRTTDEAIALIDSGYPVGYCGGTYWGLTRDANGIAKQIKSGAHGMAITGYWRNSPKGLCFWVANTGHGKHCSGPKGPIEVPDVYAQCGSWMPESRITPVLRAGDCFAHTFVEGWPVQKLPDYGTGEYL